MHLYTETIEKDPDTSFYYEDSQKLNSSMDLLKINICDRVFFEELLAAHGVRMDSITTVTLIHKKKTNKSKGHRNS